MTTERPIAIGKGPSYDFSTCCRLEPVVGATEELTSPLLLSSTMMTRTRTSVIRRRRRRRQFSLCPCCCCCCCCCCSKSSRSVPSILLVLFAVWCNQRQQPVSAYSLFPSKPSLNQELGCSPTLSVIFGRDFQQDPFYFDPLGLATSDNFARFRETELKSGRICQAALLQTMAIPFLQKTWLATDSKVSSGPPSFLGLKGLRQTIRTMDGGILTHHVSTQDVVKVVGTCFVLESLLVMPELNSMPGDYGLGWFGARDKGRHERELICELEHCRLAMIAFVVQLVLEQRTGLPWDKQWG